LSVPCQSYFCSGYKDPFDEEKKVWVPYNYNEGSSRQLSSSVDSAALLDSSSEPGPPPNYTTDNAGSSVAGIVENYMSWVSNSTALLLDILQTLLTETAALFLSTKSSVIEKGHKVSRPKQ